MKVDWTDAQREAAEWAFNVLETTIFYACLILPYVALVLDRLWLGWIPVLAGIVIWYGLLPFLTRDGIDGYTLQGTFRRLELVLNAAVYLVICIALTLFHP